MFDNFDGLRSAYDRIVGRVPGAGDQGSGTGPLANFGQTLRTAIGDARAAATPESPFDWGSVRTAVQAAYPNWQPGAFRERFQERFPNWTPGEHFQRGGGDLPGTPPAAAPVTAAPTYFPSAHASSPMVPSPQQRLAAGTVPMMGYISTPMGTSRNPMAPSYAVPTNPSANPTGWLEASYAAANARYPNAQVPALVSMFKLPSTQMHPGIK
jgi:hypothetical protein